jgi:hypothetical protein
MSSLFPKPFTVRRQSGAYNSSGIWVEGTESTFTAHGSLQPGIGSDAILVIENGQQVGTLHIRCNEKLIPQSQETGTLGDIVEFDGNDWVIQQERTHNQHLIDHYHYVAVMKQEANHEDAGSP